MSILTAQLPYEDRHGNEIYTDFRNMLRIWEIFGNPEYNPAEQWVRAMTRMYGNIEELETPHDLLADELHWFFAGGDLEESTGRGRSKAPLYDFDEDADYFVGAFYQVYGIDLTSEDTQLHWWLFLALFRSLPEDTQLTKRIYYRGVDTSKMKGDMKREYEQMKKDVALKRKKKSINRPTQSLRERLLARQEEIKAEA